MRYFVCVYVHVFTIIVKSHIQMSILIFPSFPSNNFQIAHFVPQ